MNFPILSRFKRWQKISLGDPSLRVQKWKVDVALHVGLRCDTPTKSQYFVKNRSVRNVYIVKSDLQQPLFCLLFSKITRGTCCCQFSNILWKVQLFETLKLLNKDNIWAQIRGIKDNLRMAEGIQRFLVLIRSSFDFISSKRHTKYRSPKEILLN